ncbi:hypothetical protein [Halalkalibacter alkalisediminis]|uniref:hypothetical protein n=1 Tax=Halalkalibacter alkalisediminis TaxID=935616 RepID=UPI00235F2405|nr:hypothetical protein [Halalkalibacter alkalisediminis]
MFLIVLFSATVVPMLSVVYLERVTIREELKALTLVEESIHEFLIDGVPRFKGIDAFEIRSEIVSSGIVKTCSNWIGSNGREYEHCLLAKN